MGSFLNHQTTVVPLLGSLQWGPPSWLPAVVVPSQALKCPLLCRLTWLRSEHSVFLHWAIYSSVADMQLNKSMSNSSTMALLHASRSMAGLPQLCRGTSAFSASASLELLVLQHCPPPLLPPAFLPHPCLCPAIVVVLKKLECNTSVCHVEKLRFMVGSWE